MVNSRRIEVEEIKLKLAFMEKQLDPTELELNSQENVGPKNMIKGKKKRL